MKNKGGVEIETIEKGSAAERYGLLAGDKFIAVNGNKIRDAIDLMFYGNEPELDLLVSRENKALHIAVDAAEIGNLSALGIEAKPFKIKTCRNNCIFCFVSQLPKGLRRSLYVRDEDYRMSFLYGNYMTMTNLSDADKKRIVEQRLSPLYISVHSTDTAIRNKLIGNADACDILKEIKFLADNRIRMHVQIVLCPGYNDGKNLRKTLTDLYRFYPYVMSIAVVPLGLTAHRKKALKPVDRDDALSALEIIHKLEARFKKKHGEYIVYAADELYIKAGAKFPALDHYGELPQIENGVGMVPLFIHQARKAKVPESAQNTGKRFVTFTGTSFYPFLAKFIEKLKKSGINIEAIPVKNAFFGESVTVAGLLTGRDVMKTLCEAERKEDILLIPDVVIRDGDDVFLDDVSRHDVEDVLGIKAVIVESTPRGLVDSIVNLSR